MNVTRRLMSRHRTVTRLLELTSWQHQKRKVVVKVSIPQVELNAKFVEKDDDIEKPQDDQIRQGERGVKQMTVKTSIMGRACFGLPPSIC